MNESWKDWDCPEVGLRILVARRQFLTTWSFLDLAAPHWRLYAFQGGGAWVKLGRQRLDLAPDRLWLVPPETSFHSGNDRPVGHFYVHFLIQPVWKKERRAFFQFPLLGALREKIETLDQAREPWPTSCVMQQLILSVLALLPPDGFETPDRDPRLRHLVALMTSDAARPWDNRALAREVGMHPIALVRWFKQHTGQTPRAFLLERRVQEACLRLHHTDQSMETIASATGFCDRYHLSRVFKQHRGEGPAAFRRKWAGLPASRKQNDWS